MESWSISKIEIPHKFRKPWKNIVKTIEKATRERERESKTKGRIQNRKDGGSERVDGVFVYSRGLQERNVFFC